MAQRCSPGRDTAISAFISLAMASHMALPNLGGVVGAALHGPGRRSVVCVNSPANARWPRGVSKIHKFKTRY